MRAAAATADGVMVSGHFGNARNFCVIDIDETDWTWEIAVERTNETAPGSEGDGSLFDTNLEIVSDCGVVFVSRIGPHGKSALERQNIQVLEVTGKIDDILSKYIAWLQKQKRNRKK
jgi:predicted Fe-Mo cluster-binding NifX family protein